MPPHFATPQVRDLNQDAEDNHFVVEEQVTAVAAADTVRVACVH